MWNALLYALTILYELPCTTAQSLGESLASRRLAVGSETPQAPSALPSIPSAGWTWNRRTLKDWQLSDIAIIATLDGSLHALERQTGETRWTISSADSAIRASKNTVYNQSHEAMLDTKRDTWIVEPIDDGCLYTFNARDGLYKLPFGIKQLVENSPFTVPGDDKVYVGERRTTLYSVDPRNGNILQAYGSGFGHTSSSAPKCPVKDSLDELDDDNECIVTDPNAKDILKIGRNTYLLTIFSGSETLWNVTYTEWVPNSVDADLETQYAGTFDGTYISPLYDGKVIAHQTETNEAVWFKDLQIPAVRVFDVLQMQAVTNRGYATSDVEAVAIVAQPLDPHFAEIKHENYVDGDGSTYIGKTSEGDWFALSASKCPLVSGAPLSKYSAGTGKGLVDDLLGIHTHNRVTEQQAPSPGHLLTIEDSSTVDRKLIEGVRVSQTPSYALWLVSLICLLAGIVIGAKKFTLDWSTKFSPPILSTTIDMPTEDGHHVAEQDEMPSLEQAPAIPSGGEKALPSLPSGESGDSEEMLASTESNGDEGVVESPKPKRKRGARGGKKVRQLKNAAEEEQKPSEEVETVDVADTQAIKIIQATPLPGPESTFPLQINSLIVTDQILGYGSHGTIVYKGSFEGRDVAVKRMLLDFYDIASHEVALLQESDDHPNVIRYYCKQERERFLYIALELCAASLADIIERPHEFELLIENMTDVVDILRQMAQGIQYLHSLKIVHRDLKPQNILVNLPRKSVKPVLSKACVRLVISDFGLCKKLDADQSSFRATTAQAAGTSGWRAPELLTDDSADVTKPIVESSTSGSVGLAVPPGTSRKVSRAIDIFSLGCVFYYVLSNGSHPFGDRYMREANIIRNECTIDLSLLGDRGILAEDLIRQMILPDPKARPDATTVLSHPFFWSAERRLAFLLDISDRFESEERDPPSPLLLMLESEGGRVMNNNWYARLDKIFIENLGKYRKYNGNSILDLLRALRNKKHHYQDLPENVQVALGPLPGGFLHYFCSRFPLLLLHTYYLAKEELAHEATFIPYYM